MKVHNNFPYRGESQILNNSNNCGIFSVQHFGTLNKIFFNAHQAFETIEFLYYEFFLSCLPYHIRQSYLCSFFLVERQLFVMSHDFLKSVVQNNGTIAFLENIVPFYIQTVSYLEAPFHKIYRDLLDCTHISDGSDSNKSPRIRKRFNAGYVGNRKPIQITYNSN